MDKNEKLKLGDIYFAPKEFFLNNSVGKLKQKIESNSKQSKSYSLLTPTLIGGANCFCFTAIVYSD